MWDLDYKESWVPKNWCFWTMVLEKILESPLDSREIQAVNPIVWPPDGKNWLIGKDPEAGKDWRQEEKGMTEDEMIGWHHRLDGCEFEQALWVGDGQGGLACCSPWGCRVSTWLSDWTELKWTGTFWKPCFSTLPVFYLVFYFWIRNS